MPPSFFSFASFLSIRVFMTPQQNILLSSALNLQIFPICEVQFKNLIPPKPCLTTLQPSMSLFILMKYLKFVYIQFNSSLSSVLFPKREIRQIKPNVPSAPSFQEATRFGPQPSFDLDSPSTCGKVRSSQAVVPTPEVNLL